MRQRQLTHLVGVLLTLGCLLSVAHPQRTAATHRPAERFFPMQTFDVRLDLDQFLQGWFAVQLEALQERPVYNEKPVGQSQMLRFLWLRTFHHPVAIRIEIAENGSGTLFVKEADGAGGYAPGKLIRDTRRPLTPSEVTGVEMQVSATEFWSLPGPQPKNEAEGCDGSDWIIEGVRQGEYHAVICWTPSRGPVYQLGSYAIQLAGLTIPANEFY